MKTSFADPRHLNRTFSAANGAEALGLDDEDIVDVIAALTTRDFDKSMRSEVDDQVWQDVYKPMLFGQEIYIKFTLDGQSQLLLISFKRN